ncbi:XdhC/CoxI family protein [Christensenellaceae bacterium OttesenSCG-928-K19]|nr:XdhC/CoxI family protein [Christensenellaceae bacterium OttesenSCG-928-K19]
MKLIFETMLGELAVQRDVMLVTTVTISGSTPRCAGAQMVMGEAGRLAGTIGGGAVEFKAQKLAEKLLSAKESAFHEFSLQPNSEEDLGMVCGGDMTVLFQFISHDDAQMQALLNEAVEKTLGTSACWLVTRAAPNGKWDMRLAGEDQAGQLPAGLLRGEAACVAEQEEMWFAAPFVSQGFVYLFGGGHVTQALEPVLSRVGFRCAVFEDREEFAKKELFPTVEKIILGDFRAVAKKITVTENDYIVIVTRGHEFDYDVAKQALATPACYIGLMGSPAKLKHVFGKLQEDGFAELDLKRIYAPIGVPIKSETPAEIAISIAGEMIRVRAEIAARQS